MHALLTCLLVAGQIAMALLCGDTSLRRHTQPCHYTGQLVAVLPP